ncbi:DUF5642 family protein [Mycolicibacterium neoaurum]|uniref:DUF5642 family protein n=1 Tax=Mycolicibacterium neoaurum TaxID=1795 RepID=UPI00248C848A|nr:DUF5642 family protein [Mycolicibacterium neoaurum]WBP95018.1 DUF5642 family protein [Mycolicibacterium neoaurum]WBS08684.1 DUF5642 family protein [Mycolicibacterium neoaurum]
MLTSRALALITCAAALTACSSADSPKADIAGVFAVKSVFDSGFQVTTTGPTGIDPKMLAPQNVPAGVTIEPAACAKFASGLAIPEGAQGNMAATTAEGKGNRFIAIAVQTSEPVPPNDPGPDCQKVAFGGPGVRGLVEVVESPQIEGARVLGTHRVVQTTVDGKPRSGELFNYVANFDSFMVIVTANPLVVPNTPVAPVDTEKAREMLTAAVEDVRAGRT